ncbi:MAG: M14 family metallocarboxypeptidase [Verrucomicrobiota bacterium]
MRFLPPFAHSPHDFEALLQAWRTLAERRGWALEPFAEVEGYPLVRLRVPAPSPETEPVYLSAGVHGDEPAGVWALLEWAESLKEPLAAEVVPCWNPWGFARNLREDARGRDLNRCFDDFDSSPVREWAQWALGIPYRLVLCLHEDYDGHGVYLYEHGLSSSEPVGERMQEASSIPADPRAEIEGLPAEGGLLRPEGLPEDLEGLPEAVVVFDAGAQRVVTIETPSELGLRERIEAQVRMIRSVV